MINNRLFTYVFLAVMSFSILVYCDVCLAEVYLVCDYDARIPYIGKGATGTVDYLGSTYRVWLPEGLSVSAMGNLDLSGPVEITIPGLQKYPVTIDGYCLISPEDYHCMIDFPKLYATSRIVVYRSMSEYDTGIINCYPANTITPLSVIAYIKPYFYVTDGTEFGFVYHDGVKLAHCETSHRTYDNHMTYFEDAYVAAQDPPEIIQMNKEEAVNISINRILSSNPGETRSHLLSLQTAVYYNASHEHGRIGGSYLVIFYGKADELWQNPNPYLYTSFDIEMPFRNCKIYDMSEDYSSIVLTSEFPYDYDLTVMHVHYMVTVPINREMMNVMIHSLIE